MAAGDIYYIEDEHDIRWWDGEEDERYLSQEREVYPEKLPVRARKSSDLLRGVHENSSTHIRSPFYREKYPYEFKSEAYYIYKELATPGGFKREGNERSRQDIDTKKAVAPGKEELKKEPRILNAQLKPLRNGLRKKSLRERINDGEVAFYEDYIEAEIARDYCRLFSSPFNVPRHDWGGENYFFGQKFWDPKLEDIKISGRDQCKPKIVEDEPKEAEALPTKEPTTSTICKDVYDLIMSDKYLDEPKKRELLEGKIVSLFSTLSSNITRQRHPKDRLVGFHNLRNYARMIDSVTKCPLIHVELQSALRVGWHTAELASKDIGWKVMPIKEAEKADELYAVTQEQLDKANEILANRRKVEKPPQMSTLRAKRYGISGDSVTTVGGGRYEI